MWCRNSLGELAQTLLKETNRNESIKLRLNKFKGLFKNIDIMPKFDKDVFECLIDKVIIGETLEETINPYTIRFICKNGTEINCKDKFTAMSDKQHSNNTATSEKQHRKYRVNKNKIHFNV